MIKTTGIGSLPFYNLADAINFSLNCDMPFVPELTKLDENLLNRNNSLLLNMGKLCFKKKLKNQIIGPATFCYLTKKNFSDYYIYYKELINLHCDLKKKYQLELYLQIDEPILLSRDQQEISYLNLFELMKAEDIFPILHSCQKIDDDDSLPFWEKPYLAIDTHLNPNFARDSRLFIEGYNPITNQRLGKSEYVSYTCGFGLLSEELTIRIQSRYKK